MTIERATLLRSLGHVYSVVERRNTIPIPSNLLIEARKDGALASRLDALAASLLGAGDSGAPSRREALRVALRGIAARPR